MNICFSRRRSVKYGTTHELTALRAAPTLPKTQMPTRIPFGCGFGAAGLMLLRRASPAI
jgi:hypothetical protein